MHVILASASPRRRELLEQIGIEFEVMVSEADETIAPRTKPHEAVEELSYRKAKAVWDLLEKKETVIGSDTVVVFQDKILGKPKDAEDAKAMLRSLQGREHSVYTGVTILTAQGGRKTFHEETKVYFTPMSEAEIEAYVATKDPLDKAGAYGIQGECAKYVRCIAGDYNTVVGLPVGRLYQELARIEREDAPKKAVIFDLDGTLSDSIHSLTYSGNEALREVGFGPFGEEDYKYFVGDGAANLIKRALRASGDEDLVHFDAVFRRYREIFAVHCMDGVKPYDGMCELLTALKERGLKLAVLSNKPHEETVKVVETLFGKGTFDVIQGQCQELPIKPSPQGVFRILERLGADGGEKLLPENLLYLGDTGTDVLTGRGAGAFTIGVLWGFRKQEELLENGADALIARPMEALRFLKP